jgi:PAS domain S-box-containing protein
MKKMGPIKILILEHDPNDLELLSRTLKKSDLEYEVAIAGSEGSYIKALDEFRPNIILSDFSLPDFDGLSAFRIKMERCPETPFIVVSGTIGEERAVELIKSGITDYALKEKMYVIPLKIHRAMTEANERRLKLQAEKELEENRKYLQKIMDSSLDMICTINLDGIFVNVSAASFQILGYPHQELEGMSIWDLMHPEDHEPTRNVVEQGITHFENRLKKKTGEYVPLFWSVRWNYEERLSYSVARDVSVIKKAESELAEQHHQMQNILESITDGFMSFDRDWRIRHWNRQAETYLGKKAEDVIGQNIWDVFPEAISSRFYTVYHQVVEDRIMRSFEEFFPPLNLWVSVDAYPTTEGLSLFFRDITEKKRQASLSNLEREVLKVYTSQGSPVEESIKMLLDGIREIHPDLSCSILMERDGKLVFWGYSQLPEGTLATLAPVEMRIGEAASGTAASLKKKVVVTDISTDPLFEKYRFLYNEYGFRACTAYPLLDVYRNPLGTFSIHLKSSRTLTQSEEATVERAQYILENILENYFAEKKLKESEEKYRVLFQQSPSILFVIDPDTLRFLNVNEEAIRHYGYSREEFLEMNASDLRPLEGRNELESSWPELMAQPYYELTADHRKKSGETIRVHVKNSAVTMDNKSVRLALVSDITEKTRIERELALSQQRFKVLVQEGSDLISILNREGRYTYMSPAYSAIFGYNLENMNNMDAFALVHPDDRERLMEQFREIMHEKRMKTQPFRYRRADGEYCWLETIATNLLDDPSVEGIVINSRDITESLNNLKAIERQNKQLREIAWIQSHIVRAPVARIMGLVDLLNNYNENERMRSEMLEHIVTSANELDEVIRNIVEKTEKVDGLRDQGTHH